jgi:hypothetical protein
MSVGFPPIRVGEPSCFHTLSVFPLFDGALTPVDYTLSDDGISSGSVTVEEVSEAGLVPELLVENKGDIRVLFLEGEELVGAKQNRVLNTSVLIPAHSKTRIPVSCVEQGRWHYRSRRFGSSRGYSSSKLRYFLKASVSAAVRSSRGHRSDQGKVWEEVARQQVALGASSPTSAMADTFQAYENKVAEFRNQLRYVDGATGLAVAVGTKIVAVDLFDKSSTCRKVWERLMSGYALDALEADPQEVRLHAAEVERLLTTVNALSWQRTDPVGEGEEYRAQQGDEVHASALTVGTAPVHVSVVVGA